MWSVSDCQLHGRTHIFENTTRIIPFNTSLGPGCAQFGLGLQPFWSPCLWSPQGLFLRRVGSESSFLYFKEILQGEKCKCMNKKKKEITLACKYSKENQPHLNVLCADSDTGDAYFICISLLFSVIMCHVISAAVAPRKPVCFSSRVNALKHT